jgi:hypothetical protein
MFSRKSLIGFGALIVGVGAWAAFRPELLFVDKTATESVDVTGRVLARGSFHSGAHETKGTATIREGAGGKRMLTLTGFETSNGPALHVYLVNAQDATDNDTVTKAGFVSLGPLKGNLGDQSYEVPGDVDLGTHRAVTIWCRRFGVNFGTAPLSSASS